MKSRSVNKSGWRMLSPFSLVHRYWHALYGGTERSAAAGMIYAYCGLLARRVGVEIVIYAVRKTDVEVEIHGEKMQAEVEAGELQREAERRHMWGWESE